MLAASVVVRLSDEISRSVLKCVAVTSSDRITSPANVAPISTTPVVVIRPSSSAVIPSRPAVSVPRSISRPPSVKSAGRIVIRPLAASIAPGDVFSIARSSAFTTIGPPPDATLPPDAPSVSRPVSPVPVVRVTCPPPVATRSPSVIARPAVTVTSPVPVWTPPVPAMVTTSLVAPWAVSVTSPEPAAVTGCATVSVPASVSTHTAPEFSVLIPSTPNTEPITRSPWYPSTSTRYTPPVAAGSTIWAATSATSIRIGSAAVPIAWPASSRSSPEPSTVATIVPPLPTMLARAPIAIAPLPVCRSAPSTTFSVVPSTPTAIRPVPLVTIGSSTMIDPPKLSIPMSRPFVAVTPDCPSTVVTFRSSHSATTIRPDAVAPSRAADKSSTHVKIGSDEPAVAAPIALSAVNRSDRAVISVPANWVMASSASSTTRLSAPTSVTFASTWMSPPPVVTSRMSPSPPAMMSPVMLSVPSAVTLMSPLAVKSTPSVTGAAPVAEPSLPVSIVIDPESVVRKTRLLRSPCAVRSIPSLPSPVLFLVRRTRLFPFWIRTTLRPGSSLPAPSASCVKVPLTVMLFLASRMMLAVALCASISDS